MNKDKLFEDRTKASDRLNKRYNEITEERLEKLNKTKEEVDNVWLLFAAALFFVVVFYVIGVIIL
jgi:hypothetical protein